jgi:hypothetical protein
MESRQNGRIWHQDNAPVHKFIFTIAKINELKFEFLSHTTYSSDLALSDYLFVPNLKQRLGGKRFANNEDVESAVNGYFEKLDGFHYKQGIETIEHRWARRIELEGDCLEKYGYFF